MTTSPCLDYALYYASLGWPVLAVNWPLPDGRCSCGAIECGSIGKHPHGRLCPRGSHSATTDHDLIRRWFADFPEINIGIAVDAHRFVIDIDPRNGGEDTWEEIRKAVALEEGPVALSGGGGQHIFGYSETPLKAGTLGPGIDFKAGSGAFVVAAPSRHVSGGSYEWEMSSQPDMPLPDATSYLLKEFGTVERSNKVINLDLSRVRLSPEIKPVSAGSRNNELTRLVGKWVQNGLKPDEVDILARGSNDKFIPPLPLEEVRSIVQSMYDTDARNHPEKYAEIKVDCTEESCSEEFPSVLLRPGGLMQDLMAYVEEASAVSHPVYALAGAMTLVGSVAGERIMTETGLRTNTYTLILGYSGSGKNSPQAALPRLAYADSTLMPLNGPDDIASGPALLRHLATNNVTHCFLDEIGHLFAAMSNPKSHLAQLSGDLMKIYSKTGSTFSRPYSDTRQNIVIKRPHLSILGCSTPAKFWPSITRKDYEEGMMSRILVFSSTHQSHKPKRSIRHDLDRGLIANLAAIRAIPQLPVAGANLEGMPHVIPFDQRAAAFMDEVEDSWRELTEKHRSDTIKTAVYSRCAEHAKKCALIHAVSLAGPDIILSGSIKRESVEWAVALLQHLTEAHLRNMESNVSEGEWHAIQQRIVSKVRRERTPLKNGVTWRDLAKGLPNLKRQELQAAVDDLVKSKRTHKFIPWKNKNNVETQILIELIDGGDG